LWVIEEPEATRSLILSVFLCPFSVDFVDFVAKNQSLTRKEKRKEKWIAGNQRTGHYPQPHSFCLCPFSVDFVDFVAKNQPLTL